VTYANANPDQPTCIAKDDDGQQCGYPTTPDRLYCPEHRTPENIAELGSPAKPQRPQKFGEPYPAGVPIHPDVIAETFDNVPTKLYRALWRLLPSLSPTEEWDGITLRQMRGRMAKNGEDATTIADLTRVADAMWAKLYSDSQIFNGVTTMTQIESVELKGVKIASNMSEETIAFTGTLWINGHKAADLKNDGQGGSNAMWFDDRELEKAFIAYCANLPSVSESGHQLSMDADLWISLEVGKIDEAKYWKRKCSKTMCIILKSHTEGQFIQYKAWPYSPEAANEVRKIHGDQLAEIINERFI